TLEIPLATMHPEEDQIPGANRNIYTLRRWIDVSNNDAGVTLVSHDAPLLELCDMHAEQEWLEHLPLTNTHFYSYVMNNYWFTNYKASQGGPAIFRYSMWMHDGSCKPSESTRFADKAASPLCVVPLRVTDPNDSSLPPASMSLASIDAPHVLIQNIKWAESGEGFIIRLRELDGASTNAQVRFPLWDNFEWRRCDIVERPIEGEAGKANQGVLPIAIRGKEI
ncbi:MAG: glycosyl hydrolase-related protein, partial [Candidatus Hinthialibacter sp.]